MGNIDKSIEPLVLRYKLVAFCDDIKPAVKSFDELIFIDETMTIFQYAAGCALHRSVQNGKCKFLGLGALKNITQAALPVNYFAVSDHLNFLGTILNNTNNKSKTSNSASAVNKVKKKIGSWKSGKFLPMNLRAHMINSWIISKIYHSANAFSLRIGDINIIKSMIKSYLYRDLIEKPQEEIAIRPITEGGVGLFDIELRAKAFLIGNFLQTSINPNFRRNIYHETLLKCYVFEEDQAVRPN